MPAYMFECECGKQKELFRPMSEAADPVVCECSKPMYRDFTGEKFADCAWKNPLVSDALGVHPSQIPEEMDRLRKAGITDVEFNSEGQAVLHSRKGRRQYMELCEMHDNDGGYGDDHNGRKRDL